MLLKIHGHVDRGATRERESFVVSEDDHIDYLARRPAGAVPVQLAARLRRSHLLFLGYGLHDWSLRVFLHRVWGDDRSPIAPGRCSRRPARRAGALAERGVEATTSARRRARRSSRGCADARGGGGDDGRACAPVQRPRASTTPSSTSTSSSDASARPSRRCECGRVALDRPLRAERRRQELAAAGGRGPAAARVGPADVGGGLGAAGSCRRPDAPTSRSPAMAAAARSSPFRVARLTRHDRGLRPSSTRRELYLPLDQIEEYFVYHGSDARSAGALAELLTRPELPRPRPPGHPRRRACAPRLASRAGFRACSPTPPPRAPLRGRREPRSWARSSVRRARPAARDR